ncbi:2Fe-2S iron-sulfur cluster-binding protein [Streptomyces sp. NPDC001537]
MTHVVAEAAAAGRHPGQLHTERFAPAAPPSAEAEAGAGARDRAKAGDGAKRTIAEVLTAHGVEVELSCEQGICGACLTPVPAGEPDHRDEVQTPTSARRATGSPSAAPAPVAPNSSSASDPGSLIPGQPLDRRPARHCPGLASPTFLISASSRCRPGQ